MMNHSMVRRKVFSVELIGKLLVNLKNGKAAGLDDLPCEHLKYSHPISVTMLCKLFNLFMPMVMCLIVLAKLHSTYSEK